MNEQDLDLLDEFLESQILAIFEAEDANNDIQSQKKYEEALQNGKAKKK